MAWDFPCRRMTRLRVANPIDGKLQPSFVGLPAKPRPGSPLVVFCHKWGETYRQFDRELASLAHDAGWFFLAPNYRGPNNQPLAAGSSIAQHDIVAAIDEVIRRFQVDPAHVCLAGLSGGGHMALLVASSFPDRFAAVTVWSPIASLVDWHHFHQTHSSFYNYCRDIESVSGGPPGASQEVDRQYAIRSPINSIQNAANLAIDINHGIHDGHHGHTISIDQSIQLFNVLADSACQPTVTAEEAKLLLFAGESQNLDQCQASSDPDYGVPIYLRREAGRSRLTIFEGAHDMIPRAAFAWLRRNLAVD